MARHEPSQRPLTVTVAIAANVAIAVAKLLVAIPSRSAAMLAEGVHSLVDAGNQGLILLGIARSRRPADASHPFGYGREVYFWSLIYAVLLFGVGGGISISEGVDHLISPSPPANAGWALVVLGVAFVAEGASLFVALRAIRRAAPGEGLIASLRHSKNPAHFLVVAEDGGAVLGLVIAAIGVSWSTLTGDSRPDAIASLIIGAILCCVSISLIVHTHRFVLGQASDGDVIRGVQGIVEAEPDVEIVGVPLTMHNGPNDVLLALNVKFRHGLDTSALANAIDRLESAVRSEYPQMKRIYVEAQLLARDIDAEQPAGSSNAR
ncbi:MAG: cation diffusion facilitator family transporter [Sandaracinaceae bacterium]